MPAKLNTPPSHSLPAQTIARIAADELEAVLRSIEYREQLAQKPTNGGHTDWSQGYVRGESDAYNLDIAEIRSRLTRLRKIAAGSDELILEDLEVFPAEVRADAAE